MPSSCAIINCSGKSGNSDDISYHKFPLKRLELLRQWEAFIQKQRGPDWHASRWSSICSQHFREIDFRSLNERRTLKKSAVPTIMNLKEKNSKKLAKNKTTVLNNNALNSREAIEIANIKEGLEEMENLSKSICRFCGENAISVSTICNNSDLLNTIQKCFPNVNIEQNDALPKSLCSICLKSLHEFSVFVDMVCATQTELQNKYRLRFAEKSLKIKQEPLIRVKQEVSEGNSEPIVSDSLSTTVANNDSFENSYEQQIDDIDESNMIEQKYDFCDFPIINDCDIMEIINLDDPFINIPDDDNTTNSANEAQQQQQQQQEQQQQQQEEQQEQPEQQEEMNKTFQQDADTLMQTQLLLEEHNYAYTRANHFKEERTCYKTEQNDGYEYEIDPPSSNSNLNTANLNIQNDFINHEHLNNNSDNLPATQTLPHFNSRAVKPIVTSVSAIQVPAKSSNGIVVLNESIVKSGSGSQLHECMVCQLKFHTIAKLKQHYTQTHGTPMVSLPAINLEKPIETNNNNVKDEELTLNNTAIDEICYKAKDLPKPPNEPKLSTNTTNPSEVNLTNNNNNNSNSQLQKSLRKSKILKTAKRFHCYHNHDLTTMAVHYQQLRKLYQKLQKKCSNLEQNVVQLQLQPILNKKSNKIRPPVQLAKRHCIRNLTSKSNKFPCSICSKMFKTSNSLNQHKITHTEERNHPCHLCSRTFKRRNGLLQHLKGFHLQVKPYVCAVCKHSYALKCDMQRCKHSVMKANNT